MFLFSGKAGRVLKLGLLVQPWNVGYAQAYSSLSRSWSSPFALANQCYYPFVAGSFSA